MRRLNNANMPEPLSREQRWEIVQSLLQRSNLEDQAKQALRCMYPEAPEEMLHTAIFHTYTDGIGAAIDWLVDLELFLREPRKELSSSATYHLLYHLYNWHQFRALLPSGKTGVRERLQEIRALAEDGEIEAVIETIEELQSAFKGEENYPDFQ